MAATTQFRLPIGAKRQVTIPRDCMKLLSLEEGGELLLEVHGDTATLTPMVAVPRTELPEDLRLKFLSRRGPKPTDIPLDKFLKELNQAPPKKPTEKSSHFTRSPQNHKLET